MGELVDLEEYRNKLKEKEIEELREELEQILKSMYDEPWPPVTSGYYPVDEYVSYPIDYAYIVDTYCPGSYNSEYSRTEESWNPNSLGLFDDMFKDVIITDLFISIPPENSEE